MAGHRRAVRPQPAAGEGAPGALRPERADGRAAGPGLAEVPRPVLRTCWSSCCSSRRRSRRALGCYERDSALPYEAIAILAIVLLNAVMGYVQEARAEPAVAALRQMSAAQAQRDARRRAAARAGGRARAGRHHPIEEGDTIPADAPRDRVDRAADGGGGADRREPAGREGRRADRRRRRRSATAHNMVFSGTAATYGRGRAVVTATGMQTEMGRIAGLLKQTPERDDAAAEASSTASASCSGVVVVAIAVVMIATILLVEDVRGFAALFDVLILGVALAVAAVPEGLPAVVTAVLSLGVQRMARRNAIVRHLAAVETLGSATVIASDKTGTLTKNEMTVRVVVTASGRVDVRRHRLRARGRGARARAAARSTAPLRAELERALAVADRANNAVLQERDGRWTVQGDPTEGALMVAARKAGLERRRARRALRARRRGAVLVRAQADEHRPHRRRATASACCVFTKGAPDVLLARCTHELVGDGAAAADRRRAAPRSSRRTRSSPARRCARSASPFRSLPRRRARPRRRRRARRAGPRLRSAWSA